MRIDPIIRNLNDSVQQGLKSGGAGTSGRTSFADQLASKVSEVNELQKQADESMAEGAIKGASNIHETMIRLEEADLGLRMLTKFRDKAMDAYREMMRMQF